MKREILVILLLLTAIFHSEPAFQAINVPGATHTAALGVNDTEEVAGWFYATPTAIHGFILSHGRFTQIDVPGSSQTQVYAINSTHWVAGEYTDAIGDHGFIYNIVNHGFSSIDIPGAVSVQALSLTDSGEVAGGYFDGTMMHGFTWKNGSATIMDIPGAQDTMVRGISDTGEIVGFEQDTHGLNHPFTMVHAVMQMVTAPPGIQLEDFHGINSLEQIAGEAFFTVPNPNGPLPPTIQEPDGIIIHNGRFSKVHLPGSKYTIATGINRHGSIVGIYIDTSGEHGFRLQLDSTL